MCVLNFTSIEIYELSESLDIMQNHNMKGYKKNATHLTVQNYVHVQKFPFFKNII